MYIFLDGPREHFMNVFENGSINVGCYETNVIVSQVRARPNICVDVCLS